MNIPTEQFTCQQCGNCCRVPGRVHLLTEEIDPLAHHLGMSTPEFINTYTMLAPDRRGLILKEHPDGSCIMLDANDLCRVNPVKPNQCQTFPFAWTNSDSTTTCPALAALCKEADNEVSVQAPPEPNLGSMSQPPCV